LNASVTGERLLRVSPRSATGDPESVARLHAQLEPVRSRLTADAILADQTAVTEIAAPTGEEARRAEWVADRFRAAGLGGVRVDGAGNVVGARAGRIDAPPVVVCAHLDTVFPRDAIGPVRREGTRVYAPGIGDNGRGLAVMLALARAIDGETLRTTRPVRFVATTGEEGRGDLRGARHYFAENESSAAIALDGAGDDRIVHGAVGSRRYRVVFDGPGGHSWSDFGVANPLHAAAIAMARLAELPVERDPRTTLTVARTGGGLSVNSVPQRAWCEVDIRSIAADPLARIDRALRAIVDAAVHTVNATRAAGTPAVTVTVESIGMRPVGALPVSDPLVAIAVQATRLVGARPELAHASTDANVPLSLGIPAIAIGGGGEGGEVHTLGEWYDDANGLRGVARALTIVVAAAGY
jgi:acetylornithine deacetylase/succinyl-diaminopimelate desuccinylase-like protein